MRGALAEREAGLISTRVGRRELLRKTALVGTALSVAPVRFATRPSSAYAAVCRCGPGCGCGSLCCDGYTEFCCTLNGQNRCPDGTVTGGWWKVDGSQFCGGAARYYLDCNAQCNGCGCGGSGICSGACSGTPCGCANGKCTNRKAGCTMFRYGQCHQEMPCLGPIVCRMVTCTPPWVLDPACGTSSRVDNGTRDHTRPCLDQPFGAVDEVRDVGGAIRVSGWAINPSDQTATDVRIFLNGAYAGRVAAADHRDDIAANFGSFGGEHGFTVTVPAPPGDEHLVCVYAVSRQTRFGSFVGMATLPVAGPTGALDAVDPAGPGRVRVVGWAFDPVAGEAPATIQVNVDGTQLFLRQVGEIRPDLAPTLGSGGIYHGYDLTFDVAPGTHRICVVTLGTRGGASELGCRDVTIEPAVPVEPEPTP